MSKSLLQYFHVAFIIIWNLVDCFVKVSIMHLLTWLFFFDFFIYLLKSLLYLLNIVIKQVVIISVFLTLRLSNFLYELKSWSWKARHQVLFSFFFFFTFIAKSYFAKSSISIDLVSILCLLYLKLFLKSLIESKHVSLLCHHFVVELSSSHSWFIRLQIHLHKISSLLSCFVNSFARLKLRYVSLDLFH